VVISLLIAVTLTPLLTDRLLRKEREGRASGLTRLFDTTVQAATRLYAAALGTCLRARWVVIILTLALFALSVLLAARIGSEFLPKLDDGRVMVKVMMPAGTAVHEVDRILSQIETQIRDLPEIESIFTLAGGKVWGLATYEIANEGELDIQLVRKARRRITTAQFIEKIKPLVGKVSAPGGKTPVMQMKVKGIRQIGQQEVEVKVKGADVEPIFEFAKKVAARLNETPGLTNVNISMDMTKPEYRVYVDRARASAMGISVNQVASTLRALVHGVVATQYREGSEYYDIRVLVPEVRLASKSDLENLILDAERGQPVYLRDVAEVRRAVGPIEIVREDQIKEVVVRADSAGISVGEAVARAERAVAELERPSGVEFAMGGQAQMMAENRRVMGLIIGFAALFAYVVLAIQFESFSLPFLIMLNVPLALTGAFLALYMAQTPIGVTVLIGLVIMMGGIVSQGVVLLTLAEEYRMQGEAALEAIRRAAPVRVRPILMTQLTTVLGVVPLALNLGEGGDMLKPMAVAVIGGLLYSLLLTLVFLPAAYAVVRRTGHSDGASTST
jgi:multidrug efflux pump subunit AcrB